MYTILHLAWGCHHAPRTLSSRTCICVVVCNDMGHTWQGHSLYGRCWQQVMHTGGAYHISPNAQAPLRMWGSKCANNLMASSAHAPNRPHCITLDPCLCQNVRYSNHTHCMERHEVPEFQGHATDMLPASTCTCVYVLHIRYVRTLQIDRYRNVNMFNTQHPPYVL